MEPTIYKPSIYKGDRIYNGYSMYNGNGIYNDGTGYNNEFYYDSDFSDLNINTLDDKFSNGDSFTWLISGNMTLDKRVIDGKKGLLISNIDNAEAFFYYPFIESILADKILVEIEYCVIRSPTGYKWFTAWPMFITRAFSPGTGFSVSNSDYTIIDGQYYTTWNSEGILGYNTSINAIMTRDFPNLNEFHTGKCIIDKISDRVEYYYNDNLCVVGKFGNFQKNVYLTSKDVDYFVSRLKFKPII